MTVLGGKPMISFPFALLWFAMGIVGLVANDRMGGGVIEFVCYLGITLGATVILYFYWKYDRPSDWRDSFDPDMSKAMHNVFLSLINPSAKYVYIIRDVEVSGLYKIGRSRSLDRRLFDFGVKLPFQYHIVDLIECDNEYETEAYLHRYFHSRRRNGEWFDLRPDDIQWVKSASWLREATNGHKES